MVLITMESESCSWTALGETYTEASTALVERWNKRQRQLGWSGVINEPWLVTNPKYLDEEYGFSITELEPGEAKIYGIDD